MTTEFGTLREILSEWGYLDWVLATEFGIVKGMTVIGSVTLNWMMATASSDFPLMMARKAG